ncbi:MAG: hypothetical protein E7192_04080 [Erysipelotrichaceae bacterium]|nr:hypothetical protein [Erysipelotrichaceae bacterium]
MIYLCLAIFSSAMVSVTMRLSETKTKYPLALLAANYLMCSMIALVYCSSFVADISLTAFGIFSGCFYLGSFILMQYNIQQNGVVLSSTFMKLGVLVPIVASMLFFKEMPTTTQCFGLFLAVVAIVLLKGKSDQQKLMLLPLIALLVGGGLTDFTSKIFEQLFVSEWKDMFLFLTFFSAMILCIGLMMLKKQKMTKSELLYGFLIGIPNYFSARFLLLSLSSVDAIIAYPTYSVATILLVTLLGNVLFHEHLSSRHWKIMLLILTSLILLNLS